MVSAALKNDYVMSDACYHDGMYDSDNELITALIKQDESAYRFVVNEYQNTMLYLALNIVGEKVADEVVQEAWFSVMKALPKFQRRSSLKTWILTIVANEAKNRLRKEKRNVSLEALTGDDPDMIHRFDSSESWSIPPSDWQQDSPEALLSVKQMERCLNDGIEALPPMQAATLNLKERQGYSLSEICNILDVSESNVRVLLHRARNKLFRVIEHFQLTGECCIG